MAGADWRLVSQQLGWGPAAAQSSGARGLMEGPCESWDISLLPGWPRVEEACKSFKQGTECGSKLFLVVGRSAEAEAGGRKEARL